jgi:hypothetical protein
LLIIFSAVLLVVYYAFLVTETVLFTSTSFEILVPWASVDHRVSLVKLLISIVLSVGLIFDKTGSSRGLINLVCGVLQAFVVYRRNKDAIMYETSVFYASIFYETFNLWLYIVVGFHRLAGSNLSITSLITFFSCGIAFAVCLILYQMRRSA